MTKYLVTYDQDNVPSLLVNGIQIWSDGTYLYLQKHEGYDFGINKVVKILINEKSFKVDGALAGGIKTIPSGNQTINMSDAKVFALTLNANTVLTSQGGISGQTAVFIVNSLGSYTLTFNSPLLSSGVRYFDSGEIGAIVFVCDGTYWYELSDRADNKYPTRNMPFLWTFKMVKISDYATPLVGASPIVSISKNGSAFTGLSGSPPVYEIGYGWYYVNVSAADMNTTVVILRAIATGGAQTDRVIYL